MEIIDTKSISVNPFSLIEDSWFLITSIGKDGTVNTMTAASGALGHMFRKNVAYINIRKERYTHDLVDETGMLSLCFFDNNEENKKILRYLGTTSGKNENKIEKIPFTLDYVEGIPYFKECRYAFICKVIYKAPYVSEGFLNKDVEDYYYPKRDYHDLYVVDILNTLVNPDD